MSGRFKAERRGRQAETIAGWWLRLKGYRIVGRRVRCARGEVDLVARRGRTVAFVEVSSAPVHHLPRGRWTNAPCAG